MDIENLQSTAWHTLSTAETRDRLETPKSGLASEEAASRLELFGPNSLPRSRPPHFGIYLLHQLRSPLIYVLLLALAVSLVVGHLSDALFIGAIVVFNALIGAIQEYHARRSAEALQNLISDSSQVLRGGNWQQLPAEQLVPGDCVELTSGARVPADLRLLSSEHLELDESLLTGESAPVSKDCKSVLAPDTEVMERQNIAFAGSLVSVGRGIGLVVNTGSNTEVGQLSRSLSTTESARPPLFQRVERFSKNLTIALVVVVAILAVAELARHTPPLTVFMTVVALAVSAVPEGLPVALTMVLSISMRRMVRQKVIVRKLVAVESLGSCTVIATDKTGTLTLNQLTASTILFPDGHSFSVGDNADGDSAPSLRLQRIARVAALCNEARWQRAPDSGEWQASGDTVDIAFLHMADQLGTAPQQLRENHPQTDQILYEPARGYAATANAGDDKPLVCVKGALEKLLPMCETMATGDGDRPIDSESLNQLMRDLAASGARVLAVADGQLPEGVPLQPQALQRLCLLGLVAMTDPLRPEAPGAIAECRQAGIKVCMLTGDHPHTAAASARQLGLISDDSEVVTGPQLAAAGREGQDALVSQSVVYARVAPEQKLDIVNALIRQGEFVAVTGDGANDAPALTAAHVGVAMAGRGTDVAREAADLLVSDDNFASLVAGIREGRIAYSNIRKAVFFLVSTGAAEVVLFILSSLFAMPLPLTPVQLLWLNLVTNGIQNLGLAIEPGEDQEMRKPPRAPGEGLFNRLMVERILLAGLVMGGLCFLSFYWWIEQGYGETTARNNTLLLMVLFENVQVFNSRSETRSAFTHSLLRNPLLVVGVLAVQGLHIGAMYWPPLRDTLGIAPVALSDWLPLLGLALLAVVTSELQKLYYGWRGKNKFSRPNH